MTRNEPPCSGREFEQFCGLLDRLVERQKQGRRMKLLDRYVVGDFYHQRTDCIMGSSLKHIDSDFLEAVRRLLTDPAWGNWRVVVSIEDLGPHLLIVYREAFVFDGRKYSNSRRLFRQLKAVASRR